MLLDFSLKLPVPEIQRYLPNIQVLILAMVMVIMIAFCYHLLIILRLKKVQPLNHCHVVNVLADEEHDDSH